MFICGWVVLLGDMLTVFFALLHCVGVLIKNEIDSLNDTVTVSTVSIMVHILRTAGY